MSSPLIANYTNKKLLEEQFGYGFDKTNRFRLQDDFAQIVRPVAELEATLGTAAAVRSYSAANKNFLLTGTNPTSAFASGGGERAGTGATLNDRAIVAPGSLTGPAAFSSWNETTFSTSKEIRFDTIVNLPSVAAIAICVGLATSFPSVAGTDDSVTDLGAEAAVFSFATDSAVDATKFRVVSIAGGVRVDSVLDQRGGSLAPIAANTSYRLSVRLDSTRRPSFYINGKMVGTRNAAVNGLTAASALKPFWSVRTLTTAAKLLDIRRAFIAQNAS